KSKLFPSSTNSFSVCYRPVSPQCPAPGCRTALLIISISNTHPDLFISNSQTTEVLQPGEQSLHFVTSAVSPQRSPVLCCRLFPIASVGRDSLNAHRRQR